MLEDVGEFDKCGFCIGSSHFYDPATERLAKRVRTEMGDFKPVAAFQYLEDDIDSLDGVNGLLAGNKRFSRWVREVECLEAFMCMVLKVPVDADCAMFPGFLFNDFQFLGEKVAVPQCEDVADAKSGQASRSDKE